MSTIKLFNPDEINFRKLFTSQSGYGEARFYGTPRQRGFGMGSLLGRLLPFLASPSGQALLTHSSRAASNAVADIMAGKAPAEAMKTRARETIKAVTGLGRKRNAAIGYVHKPKRNCRLPSISL